MAFHDTSNLRLEVEVPTSGQQNLVQNPSGAKGAWGWVTPVNNTVINVNGFGSGTSLAFTTFAAQAAYFTSEFMPFTAGQYASARFDMVSGGTAGYNLKGRFEFYDTNKTLISSSTQSGAFPTTAGTYYVVAAQAPVGTVYIKVRYDFYNGVSNPAASTAVFTTNHMVTTSATALGVTSVRTNMVANPSFEGPSANMWFSEMADGLDCAMLVTTGTAASGTYFLRSTAAGSGSMQIAIAPASPITTTNYWKGVAITGGTTYTWQVQTRAVTVARNCYLRFVWYNSTASQVQMTQLNVGSNAVGSWTKKSYTATAPSWATWCVASIIVQNCATNEQHDVDAAVLEVGTVAGSYFDGASVKTNYTYTWSGTANASSSTETANASAYAFNPPNDWKNILGPTHSIQISRAALDVGLLTAEVLDPLLDPAVAAEIRPGKKIRVTGDSFGGGEFVNVYEGRITKANVVYVPQTRVTLTASDATAQLANQTERRGMATIANLPYILEGKGVPWNVNTFGNQVVSAPTVSTNDNASVLDQIALTRDSNLGYAWVDRDNVVNVFDSGSMSSVSSTYWFNNTTVDQSWSDIDISYDTDEIINEVTVTWLRYNSTTGETEEVTYGPWRDSASIATWGVYSQNFTITGTTESLSSIATYAQNILTKNATPVMKATSMTFPVQGDFSLDAAIALDMYDKVKITYPGKLPAPTDYYVTSLVHNITPDKWTVQVGLSSTGAAAAPGGVPSPEAAPLVPPPVVPAMLRGTTGTIAVAATSPFVGSTTVTFSTPFATVPTVVASFVAGSANGRSCSVSNVTVNGFTANIVTTNTTGFPVAWIALAS